MAEQYSMQAENLMKSAVEEYKEIVKEVKATDANLTIIRNIRVSIQGKPRRLVDIADLKKTSILKTAKIESEWIIKFKKDIWDGP